MGATTPWTNGRERYDDDGTPLPDGVIARRHCDACTTTVYQPIDPVDGQPMTDPETGDVELYGSAEAAAAVATPWTADDDEELRIAMADAAAVVAGRWSLALKGGHAYVIAARLAMPACPLALDYIDDRDREERRAAARFSSSPAGRDECATMRERSVAGSADPIPGCAVHGPHPSIAADLGLVPDPADPDAAKRFHELANVGLHYLAGPPMGPFSTTDDSVLIASHDDFEERTAIRTGAAIRWPIYAAGIAATTAARSSALDDR